METSRQLERMREAWDQRARENHRHYIATLREEWTGEDFFASGEAALQAHILTDPHNIYQGKQPSEMRVLEIGCGSGRVTRALARHFGEVHAVDISEEMITRAGAALRDCPNAHVYRNNGMDLSVVPPLAFDFAFSLYVFQHIPGYQIIESYLREVHRLLKPGALFKFQVQGSELVEVNPEETWVGVPISRGRAESMAGDAGFELRYCAGAGQEEFWLWFFR